MIFSTNQKQSQIQWFLAGTRFAALSPGLRHTFRVLNGSFDFERVLLFVREITLVLGPCIRVK